MLRQIPFVWTCPHCSHDTTITKSDYLRSYKEFHYSPLPRLYVEFIGCPNPECLRYCLAVALYQYEEVEDQTESDIQRKLVVKKQWNLVPPSDARSFPGYVPGAIRKDYEEACLIKDLSPKSSATLSRRCLQGMIRDFWKVKVKSKKLYDEIEAIKDQIDPLTWQAIHAVREMGNIGAHMKQDINLIVEVEPEEAGMLIGLIETLIKDWYINRHEREENLKLLVQTSEEKKEGGSSPSGQESSAKGVE